MNFLFLSFFVFLLQNDHFSSKKILALLHFLPCLYFLCSISLRSRTEDSTLDQTAHFVLYERTVTRERHTERDRERKRQKTEWNNFPCILKREKKKKEKRRKKNTKKKKAYEKKQETPRKITINFWIKSIFSYVLSSLRSSFLCFIFYFTFLFLYLSTLQRFCATWITRTTRHISFCIPPPRLCYDFFVFFTPFRSSLGLASRLLFGSDAKLRRGANFLIK